MSAQVSRPRLECHPSFDQIYQQRLPFIPKLKRKASRPILPTISKLLTSPRTPGLITRMCNGELNPFEKSFELDETAPSTTSASAIPELSKKPLAPLVPNDQALLQSTSSKTTDIPPKVNLTMPSQVAPVAPQKEFSDVSADSSLAAKSKTVKKSKSPSIPAANTVNVTAASTPTNTKSAQLPTSVAQPKSVKQDRKNHRQSIQHEQEVPNDQSDLGTPSHTDSKELAKSSKSRTEENPMKRKADSIASDQDDQSSAGDDDDKRRRFLERNRLAASKCRQKKKAWLQELERESIDITAKNRQMQAVVVQLREEVEQLKQRLLRHRACGCGAIQTYVSIQQQQQDQNPQRKLNTPQQQQHYLPHMM